MSTESLTPAFSGASAVSDPDDLLNVAHFADDPTERPARSPRIMGIDLARCLAVLGMMVVHIIDPVTPDGTMPWSWRLTSGNAAALFAVLAGVGIALSTGRTRRPSGRRWWAAAASLLVRAILIGLLGLALGMVVPTDTANVILPYYAVLFVLAIALLRLPPRPLACLGLVLAVVLPSVGFWVRRGLPEPNPVNITPALVSSDPQGVLTWLALTGVYPAVGWIAYLAVGMAIGRTAIRRVTAVQLLLGGTALALATSTLSWVLLYPGGGINHLVMGAQARGMTLDAFTSLLVWGGRGTLPTDTAWWLVVLAPHTTTPFDLLFTLGVATAMLGVSLMIATVAPELMRPFAAIGSMPLTMYTLHLLMTAAPFWAPFGWLEYLGQALVLLVFALAWSRLFARGPFEQLLHWASTGARDLVGGRAR